jgi:hypothetical protein
MSEQQVPTMSVPPAQDDTYQSRQSVVERQSWSPAQGVALIIGVIFVVIGGIALARTGIDIKHLSTKHVQVAGAGQTQLMAYLEIVFGLLLLIIGSVRDAGRGGMIFLGLVALIFGLIVAAQPSSFLHPLGIGRGYAILLIVGGVILLGAAMSAPVYRSMTRRSGVSQTHRQP